MKKVAPITALFLDIGGVLLNDGWGHQSREMAAMFVQIAEGLGIRSILHTDYQATCEKLASFGLEVAE